MIGFTSPTKLKSANVVISVEDAIANLTMSALDKVFIGNCGSGTTVTITYDGRVAAANTYRWLIGRGLGDLDIQCQKRTGTATMGGASLNTWLRCDTTRTWTLGVGGLGVTRTCTGYLRFRSNTTQEEITSANVSWSMTTINTNTTGGTGDTK